MVKNKNKMWKTYKYIYYWLYTWNKGLWGENDIPRFNAVVGMPLSFLSVLFSLISLYHNRYTTYSELESSISSIPHQKLRWHGVELHLLLRCFRMLNAGE